MKCEIIGYEGLQFEVGQKWKTRGGEVVEIVAVFKDPGLTYPIEAGMISYRLNGREFKNRETKRDLVELVSNTTEECIEPVENCIEEPTKWVEEPTETYKENADLWEDLDCNSLKVVEDGENPELLTIGMTETSVEDKMVEILHQLLSQRDRDLEKLSLVFNTFIKMEKMK